MAELVRIYLLLEGKQGILIICCQSVLLRCNFRTIKLAVKHNMAVWESVLDTVTTPYAVRTYKIKLMLQQKFILLQHHFCMCARKTCKENILGRGMC